ncbi:hypothetical protein HK104_009791 [Borealophlyctis nickersoniae]|nr:hypothetical protein HK104_009791 [Borealophlyctis nickersoniae]
MPAASLLQPNTIPHPPSDKPQCAESAELPHRHPPPQSDDVDEGFEDDFPDEFPFWYGGASGVQRMDGGAGDSRADGSSSDEESEDTLTEGGASTTAGSGSAKRRDTYRDQDSVLHYFIATSQSEQQLDEYLNGIIEAFLNDPSPVYATKPESAETLKSQFGKSIVPNRRMSTGDGASMEDYLRKVKANVIDKATRVSSPKMIGHMVSVPGVDFAILCAGADEEYCNPQNQTTALPYFHRPLARLLAAMNQNVVKLETASTMTFLERETIAMLHREFYLESDSFYDTYMHSAEHSLGVFASGGTVANITAMWTARNRALRAQPEKGFLGVEKAGLFKALKHYGYEGAVIVGSALMHYSFKKAADLLGLGDDGLCLIPTDENFQIRTDKLKEKIAELVADKILIIAVVGVAGTTETGSIDPLNDIATIARANSIHFHVDAAWGGPLIFSLEHRSKLAGICYADTITVDGHKQLYTPMGLGLILMRDPTLALHIRKTANYIIRNGSPDLGRYTLEGSRPATSLHLHASLHLLGRDGLGSLVTRSATLVRQMASRMHCHPNRAFQPLHDPSTNILLYRYIPKDLRSKVHDGCDLTEDEDDRIGDLTRRVQIAQASRGVVEDVDPSSSPTPSQGFVSRTRVSFRGRDVDALRVVIANPLTRWEDVESVLVEQVGIGEMVEAEVEREKRRRWVGWPFDM